MGYHQPMLRLRILGFNTQVQPAFWLLVLVFALLLSRALSGGGGAIAELAPVLLATLVIVGGSLMVHELGHAFAFRVFGLDAHIVLHGFGGTTVPTGTKQLGRVASIIIAAAGPVAGFCLAAVCLVVIVAGGSDAPDDLARATFFERALWVTLGLNAFWSAFNLLPVLPFDGGLILAAALGPERRMLTATVSLVVALLVAAYFLSSMPIAAIFVGWAGITNFLRVQRAAKGPAPGAEPSPMALAHTLQRAQRELDREQWQQAHAIAVAVLEATRNPETQKEALEIAGWALLTGNEAAAATALLDSRPQLAVDPYLRGAVLTAGGDASRAAEVLGQARRQGDERPQLAALYVKNLLDSDQLESAARVTRDILGEIPADEARAVAERAFDAAPLAAATVFEELFERGSDDPSDSYRAARGYALAGQSDAAFRALSIAVGAGYAESGVRDDPAFVQLSGDERFESALEGRLVAGAQEG